MALQLLSGLVLGGNIPVNFPIETTKPMTSASHKIAFIMQVPATGTITAISYRIATMTTSDTLKIGIYTVDNAGHPTATAYGGMVAGTQASLTANSWFTTSLGNSCSATRGDVIAVVFEWNSYVAGSVTLQVGSVIGGMNFPYETEDTGVGWTNQDEGVFCALSYGGSYHYQHGVLFATANAVSFDVNSTPDEQGLLFKVPVQCEISGFYAPNFGAFGTAGENVLFTLFQSLTSPSILETVTWNQAHTGNINGSDAHYIMFDSNHVLSAATDYIIAVAPQGTDNWNMLYWDFASVALLDTFAGGSDLRWAERSGGTGDFTETTTKRALIFPVIDKIHDGAASGGGFRGAIYNRI